MLHELPWLPQPSPTEREAVRLLDGSGGLADIARLAVLAELRWDASELASIGRKLRKFVRALDDGWREKVGQIGLSPASLLMLFSTTASHMVDSLTAVALARGIILECRVVEYQEPEAWLAQNAKALGDAPPDAVLISLNRSSLRLEAAIGEAADAEASVQAAVGRVILICNQIGGLASSTVIVENLPHSATDPQSSMDAWLPGSPRMLINAFNQRLAALRASHSYILFDVAGVADLVGLDTWNSGRHRYTAKMAFSTECVPLYAQRFVTLLASLRGKSRKVLVLDLDNTLWGGVIGDDGLDGIHLGGDDALGKIYTDIQKMALGYKKRGILLCVASKNTLEIALDAFRRHPEMILRENDITQFKINWENKASNIAAMAEALNLGLDAFVFIDDNPAERKHVRDALPAVAVPELTQDPSAWLPMIQAAAYFEQQTLSKEDLARAEYYKNNTQRSVLQNSAVDEKAFLESLQMVMPVSAFDSIGRKRIAQLIAKSNQFNLTTRRYSEAQIAEFETDAEMETLQIRLEDILGDNGMIAVVICRKGKPIWEIDTWLMSCRVLGRGVEVATLNVIVERAKQAGALELRGRYIPTLKNGIVADHYKNLAFEKIFERGDGETMWRLSLDNFVPRAVLIKILEKKSA